MKNLSQIRAKSALDLAKNDNGIRGREGGDAMSKIPSMINTNGLLAALAFSIEKKAGYIEIFHAIAKHLQSEEISITKDTSSAEGLLKCLINSDSQTLRRATAEALEWLSFARRFIKSKSPDNS